MAAAPTPHLVIDDFLPTEAVDRLLLEILAAEPHFTPAQVGDAGTARNDPMIRSSLRLPGRAGVDLEPLKTAVMHQHAALCAATGISVFPVHHFECSIVAHGDGDFYGRHVDIVTRNDAASHHRVLSCVFYLHHMPRRFSGGALAIHPIGPIGGVHIEPVHNRLVAFPAFVPHEVLPITCPGNAFADRRFSVNCWFHRARADGRAVPA